MQTIIKRIDSAELLARAKAVQRKLYAEDYDEILSYEDLEAIVRQELRAMEEAELKTYGSWVTIKTEKEEYLKRLDALLHIARVLEASGILWLKVVDGYDETMGDGTHYVWKIRAVEWPAKDGGNEDERDGAQGAVQVHDLPGAGAPGGAGGPGGV